MAGRIPLDQYLWAHISGPIPLDAYLWTHTSGADGDADDDDDADDDAGDDDDDVDDDDANMTRVERCFFFDAQYHANSLRQCFGSLLQLNEKQEGQRRDGNPRLGDRQLNDGVVISNLATDLRPCSPVEIVAGLATTPTALFRAAFHILQERGGGYRPPADVILGASVGHKSVHALLGNSQGDKGLGRSCTPRCCFPSGSGKSRRGNGIEMPLLHFCSRKAPTTSNEATNAAINGIPGQPWRRPRVVGVCGRLWTILPLYCSSRLKSVKS